MGQLLAFDHLIRRLVVLVRLFSDRLDCRGARRGGRRGRGRGRRRQGRLRLRRRRLLLRLAAHPEHQLHVVTQTSAPDASVQVVFTGRRYEVVVLPREELQAARLRRKRPERYSEKHQFVRFIAYRDYPGVRISYPTRIIFLFTHVIYYILFRVLLKRPWGVHWTYYIHLVVFELCVSFIQVEYMVCVIYSEYAVCCVPMYVEGLGIVPHHAFDEENKHKDGPRRMTEAKVCKRHHPDWFTTLAFYNDDATESG